ncbi:transcriptional regulator [Salinisphaera sp. T31B1]
MRWNELEYEACSVARTLSVIGDRWTLMLLRECFMGVRRFEHFQARLDISRTIVRDRLTHLVDHGVLERRAYETRPPRHEYRLTEAGRALHPILVTIAQWGDAYRADDSGPPLVRMHRPCGHALDAQLVCTTCHTPVLPQDVSLHRGPGGGSVPFGNSDSR